MNQNQVMLTTYKRKEITEISLFVSLVSGRYWNKAPLAIRAPLNDANLLEQLNSYPNEKIATAAVKAFRRHLWYFSEHLF